MINFIKNLLGIGTKESVTETVVPTAPYKIEPPVATPVSQPATKPAQVNNKKPKTPNSSKPKTARPAGKNRPANKAKAKK